MTYQMANLGCLLVCTFFFFRKKNIEKKKVCTFDTFQKIVIVAAHTNKNFDISHKQCFQNKGYEGD